MKKNEQNQNYEPIAIIGMGCRFPGGANDPYAFWENIKNGKDCITKIPENRFNADEHYSSIKDKPGTVVTKWGGYIDGFDEFDPAFFGISPREAEFLDPQQRKLLQVTWEALEDGGQKPAELAGKDVGVFVGAFTVDYQLLQYSDLNFEGIGSHTATGVMMTMVSNRISYIFDFKGPSITMDTACSSSLVAVDMACSSLHRGECSMAVVGGCLLQSAPQYTVSESKGGFLSPTGSSHAFDSSANGYVRAEGIGVVVLKKLKDALRDGDPVNAIILGSGANQDGHTNGITVPNPDSQLKLIKKVCERAGVTPGQLQYVEAHGTGTPVGDPLEANVLGEVLGIGRKNGDKCFIGSVKTNIGHAEAAAGTAGLIKTVMCLKNKQIPPHLHLKEINPKIKIDQWPYEIPGKLESWPEHDGPAMAGVNSFGFGGTNAHLILMEAPENLSGKKDKTQQKTVRPKIMPVTAKDEQSLADLVNSYKEYIEKEDVSQCDIDNIGYTAGLKKQHLEERVSFVYSSKEDLINKMNTFVAGEPNPLIVKDIELDENKRRLVWVFTGMGPQWWAMGRELYNSEPVYREMIDRCDKEMSKWVDWSLVKELNASQEESHMEETWISQPANFALQVALAALWRSFGIEPDAIVGHSTGEAAAFYEAGVYSLEDAVKVIINRSRLQQTVSGMGKMAAIGLPASEVEQLLKPYGNKLSIAAINAAGSVTVSGDEAALNEFMQPLTEKGVFCKLLKVQIPFHSAYMDPIKDDLLRELADIKPNKTKVSLYSTARGCLVDGAELDASYWWENVRGSVLFKDALDNILKDGFSLFVEVGPHPVLAGSITECLEEKKISGKILPSIRRKENEQERFLATLAELHNLGFNINWAQFYPDGEFVRLPCYAWKKERYWIEPKQVEKVRLMKLDHPLLGRRLPTSEPCWQMKMDTEKLPYIADHKIQGNVVFPAAAYIEMAFSAAKNYSGNALCSLDEMDIKKALFLSEAEPTKVQLIMGHEQSSFKIVTYDDKDNSSIVHAAGRIRTVQNTKIAASADFEAIKERIGKSLDRPQCYELLDKLGYNYGPNFHTLNKIWMSKDEILAHIQVTDNIKENMSEYHIHPTLLDGCFQSFVSVQFAQSDEKDKSSIRLPVSIGQVRIFAGGLEEVWAHVKITVKDDEKTVGDIVLYDKNGLAVGEIKDFVAQEVDKVSGSISVSTIDSWLYDLEWVEKEITPAAASEKPEESKGSEGWIVLADSQGVGKALKAQIEEKGGYCRLVYPGDKLLLSHDSGDIYAAPESSEDFAALINKAFNENKVVLKNIVHLWNLDIPCIDEFEAGNIPESKLKGCYSLVSLAKALTETNSGAKLWLITRGTQMIDGCTAGANPFGAASWGTGRVLWYQEIAQNRGKMIDLDPSVPDKAGVEQEAARILLEAENPGDEEEIVFRGEKRYTSRLSRMKRLTKPLSTQFRSDGCYVVTGAFGALGQVLCRLMVKHGARRLILLSRTSIPQRKQWLSIKNESSLYEKVKFIKELEAAGAEVITASVDLTDEKQVAAYFKEFGEMGYPPIRGVFHCAGVVKDTLVPNMDLETFDMAYNPKVISSYLLHKYLINEPLEHFVLFSSVASMIITAGQTNYAAGNAFLDALANYRRSVGLPALSIDWGPWAVGMIKELNLIEHYKNRGMFSITPEVGMEIMDRIMGQDVSQIIVGTIDNWPLAMSWYPVVPPLFSQLLAEVGQNKSSETKESFTDIFRETEVGERKAVVEDHFVNLISNVLHAKRSQVDINLSLNRLGLDSILAVDLRNKIMKYFNVSIPVVNLLSGNSISQISEQVYNNLCELVKDDGDGSTGEIEVKIHTNPEEYPLTYGQKAIWFLKQLNPDSPAYNISGTLEVPISIDVDIFFRALKDFVSRHPSLRANFYIKDGQPVQRISPVVKEDFSLIDVQGMEWENIYNLMIEESRKPFDLENGAVFRIRVLKRAEDNYLLLFNVYHIVSDATSSFISVNEIFSLYDSYRKGAQPQLIPAKSSYLDFLNWQNKLLAGKDGERMFKYWKDHLSDDIPVLNLITDKPRPIVQTNNGASCFFNINSEISGRIHELSQKTGATIFMILISAFYVMLHKYTSQEEIIIGTPVSGRTQEEFNNVYGYFVNPLPLKASFKDDPTYEEFIGQIQNIVLNGLDNQEYPFALLVEKLKLQHDPSRSALFQVMFVMLVHRIENTEEKYGIPMNYIELPEEEGQFDLLLSAYEDTKEGIFNAVFKYNTDLFYESTIQRMIGHYLTILDEVTRDMQKRISECNMLTQRELECIMNNFRLKATKEIKVDAPVHLMIEQVAAQKPDEIAVSVPSETDSTVYMSYSELNSKANQMARYLRNIGVENNTIVGICMDKSKELAVSVLAVLKAGGAYLPIDPYYPQDRITHMLDDSKAGILITHSSVSVVLPDGVKKVVNIDTQWKKISTCDDSNIESVTKLSDTAYVIYTSASTGKPKGAMISHYNWASIYKSYEIDYELPEKLHSHLQMSSFSFDIFCGDFARALCSGGKLILCRKEIVLNIPVFYSVMVNEKAESGDFVPATIRNLVTYLENVNKKADFMKLFIVGADVWKVEEYERLKALCGDETRIIHTYGLTEATVDNTFFEGDTGSFDKGSNLPIGRPAANSHIYILDSGMNPVPVGVAGEIYIGGHGVGQGYINNPEMTEKRFVEHSFDGSEKLRLYKTGDVARWDEKGNICMLGRIDNQVKVRGLRIELGEIERHLMGYPDIETAIVIPREDNDREKTLCAYYVVNGEAEPSTSQLSNWLSEFVPLFMIPSFFMRIEQIPLSPNGKVDKRALPIPNYDMDENKKEQPKTVYEKKVAQIWTKLFGIKNLGLNDDFYEIGGSSIKFVELIVHLQKEFNIRITVNRLFKHSTLGGMAKLVEDIATGKEEGAEPYFVYNPSSDRKVYCFPPAGGYSIVYETLAMQMDEYSLVAFNYLQEEDKVKRYADLITDMDSKGPYVLFGYSLGGNMAFEVAKELESRGCQVMDVVVMDSYRVLEAFEDTVDEMQMFRKELSEHLKRHMGSELVQEHIFMQARNQIEYFARVLNTGSVNARVHLILEDRPANDYEQEWKKTGKYNITKEDSWNESSRNSVNVYKGFGWHQDMLGEENISKNSEIIKNIIDTDFVQLEVAAVKEE
ncbi:MAG TPA: amino acid adenylation domain-containing protein [Ruminiclostridium sp.]|nr:amino acid adenylation domain-containing protein [Ruminiclostridium sp.]